MNKTVKLVLVCLLAVILVLGAYVLYERLSGEYMPEESIESGEKTQEDFRAPDFEVVDGNGNKVSLSSFFGKPVVLNFWASWCPPCKAEMPDFEEAYKEFGSSVNFVMINSTGGRETLDTAKAFLKDTGYTFPVYFDTQYSAAMAYGVNSLPMTFFIDKDGNLVTYANSMIDAVTLRRGIDMIAE
ncbi:MAG: TlpA family protein disulfide reductase [Oscillospiraceae bacterium]|nr:TlpA family protein disulfide reductase [Oscillospiraceae bacterium]